jgi:hypothetical protein
MKNDKIFSPKSRNLPQNFIQAIFCEVVHGGCDKKTFRRVQNNWPGSPSYRASHW